MIAASVAPYSSSRSAEGSCRFVAGIPCFAAHNWNAARISFPRTSRSFASYQIRRHVAAANAPETRSSSSLTKCEEDDAVDEKALLHLRSHIFELLEDGDDASARAIITANNELLQEQLDAGIRGISQAALLDVLAQAHMDIADLKGAERLLKQLESVMEQHSSRTAYASGIFEHMGIMYSALQKPQEALKFYKTCLHLQERQFGRNDARLARALLGCADTHGILRNDDESIKMYRRVVNILENAKDEESLAVPLSRIGGALLEQGNAPEAELFLNRALKIVREGSEKQRDDHMVQMLCMLAQAKRLGEDLDGSSALYEEALSIMERCMESDYRNSVMEIIRTSYATVLTLMKRDKKAQELLEANLLTKQSSVGPSDASLIVHLKNLAASYGNSGDVDKCEAVLRRYLALATGHFGPLASQVMEPLDLLAKLLHRRGKQVEEAESFARQVLHISEKTNGKEHPFTGEACNSLAAILHSQSSYRESTALMWRRLKIQEKWMGADNIALIPTLEQLVNLTKKLKQDTTSLESRLRDLRNEEPA